MNTRIKDGIITVVLFLIEFSIAMWVHDSFIRPYVGDVLVVVLLYFFVRTVVGRRIRRLPFWVFWFAALVEVLQYFHLPKLLGLEHVRAAVIILGSTFDIADLLCYAVGCGFLLLYEKIEG